jgi:hypothetical protein
MPPPARDSHIREKLYAAVDTLATSAELLQRRLQSAGTSALSQLVPTDFSELEEREPFDRIRSAITKLNPPGPGHIRASTAACQTTSRRAWRKTSWSCAASLCAVPAGIRPKLKKSPGARVRPRPGAPGKCGRADPWRPAEDCSLNRRPEGMHRTLHVPGALIEEEQRQFGSRRR